VHANAQVMPPSVSCTTTVASATDPTPNLECAAIWDLAGSGVEAVNATDPARQVGPAHSFPCAWYVRTSTSSTKS
jgi:hypothetical protein